MTQILSLPWIATHRRRHSGASGAPSDLQAGEIAVNEQDTGGLTAWLGVGDDGNGNSIAQMPIGGSGAFIDLSTTQTVGGNKIFQLSPQAPTPVVTDVSNLLATTRHVRNIKNPLYFYGFVGTGAANPLSGVGVWGGLVTAGFTLAQWQALVPQVVALTDEVDGVAIQAVLNAAAAAGQSRYRLTLPEGSIANISRAIATPQNLNLYIEARGAAFSASGGTGSSVFQHGTAAVPARGELHAEGATFLMNANGAVAIDAYFYPNVGAGSGKVVHFLDLTFLGCTAQAIRLTNPHQTVRMASVTTWVYNAYVALPAIQIITTVYTAADPGPTTSGRSYSHTYDDCQANGFQNLFEFDIQSTAFSYTAPGGYFEGVIVRSCRAYNGLGFLKVRNGRNPIDNGGSAGPTYVSPLWHFADCDYLGFGGMFDLSGVSEVVIAGCWFAPGQSGLPPGYVAPAETDLIKITSSDNIRIRDCHFNIGTMVSSTVRCIDLDAYTGFVDVADCSVYSANPFTAVVHAAAVRDPRFLYSIRERGTKIITSGGNAVTYMQDDGGNQVSEGRVISLGSSTYTRANIKGDGSTEFSGVFGGLSVPSSGIVAITIPSGLFRQVPNVISIQNADYNSVPYQGGLRTDLSTTTSISYQFTGAPVGAVAKLSMIVSGT